MRCLAFILFFSFASYSLNAQNFYDLNSIQKIEIYFSQTDWDYELDTLKAGTDGYLQADSVRINGALVTNVGVKYKGNSSYDATYNKNPLHISIDEFVGQTYNGIKTIKLGNGYADPSLIREVLSYSILKNYMHCPRANFAKLYINDTYIGLYSNVESIDKSFCSDHFYSSDNTFVKCNPILNPSPATKSNLKYITSDSSSYFNYYEMKSNNGWNELTSLCDSISNNTASVSSLMDMDRFIWMLAFDNALVNLDSYLGVFAQNYYLYKDNTGHFNPVIWDLNMSFGGFPYIGSGNSSMGALTNTNLEQLTISAHSNDAYWPIIKLIQNNPTYKKMYAAHLRTIIEEFFANDNYTSMATSMQSIIDFAVAEDVNMFFTYSEYQNSLTNAASAGSYDVPGITTLMSARTTFLQSTAEFTAIQPSISNINSTTASMASNFFLTCNASNANAVFAGTRFDYTEKFVRSEMFDDGLHGDGNANDQIYGIELTMNGASMQYYFYAENSACALFSPARAEHEFYTLTAAIESAGVGDIVINEFVAQNQTGITDEAGQYEDWIELYNLTNQPLSLAGIFISDDINNPQQFSFSANVTIPASGWITLWADQDNATSPVHLNFKLSASGESLILSNTNGEILDSLTFGPQSPDLSMARCPDGTGAFETLSPTFGFNNCPISVSEIATSKKNSFTVFPNPTTDFAVIRFNNHDQHYVTIKNEVGQIVFEKSSLQPLMNVDTENWSNGIYFIIEGNDVMRLSVCH